MIAAIYAQEQGEQGQGADDAAGHGQRYARGGNPRAPTRPPPTWRDDGSSGVYPAHGLALFPPFPRDERVFVAMSFHSRFEARWKLVIEPAAQDVGLQAFRVDVPKASSSIPADILVGIAQSRLVLADLTSVHGYRNGNVMYEVGIAHSCRQPEEVILFRPDTERLLFDVSTIRVNPYDPDGDPGAARISVAEALRWALREVEAVKALSVQGAAEALDQPSFQMLCECIPNEGREPPKRGTAGDALRAVVSGPAISRLLELGLIRTEWHEIAPEQLDATWNELSGILSRYHATEFGRAVAIYVGRRFSPSSLSPPDGTQSK